MEHELIITTTTYGLFAPHPITIYFYGNFEAVKARIAKERVLFTKHGNRPGDYLKFKLSVFSN